MSLTTEEPIKTPQTIEKPKEESKPKRKKKEKKVVQKPVIIKYLYFVEGKVNSKGTRYYFTRQIEAQDEDLAISIFKERAKTELGSIRNITCVKAALLNEDNKDNEEFKDSCKLIEEPKAENIQEPEEFVSIKIEDNSMSDIVDIIQNRANKSIRFETKDENGIYQYLGVPKSLAENINGLMSLICMYKTMINNGLGVYKLQYYTDKKMLRALKEECDFRFNAASEQDALEKLKTDLKHREIPFSKKFVHNLHKMTLHEIVDDEIVYSGLIKIFEITNKVSNADNVEVSVHKIQKPIIGMSNQATLGTIDNINNILKGVLDSNDFRNKR